MSIFVSSEIIVSDLKNQELDQSWLFMDILWMSVSVSVYNDV